MALERNLWYDEYLTFKGNPSIYVLKVGSETFLNEAKKIRKCNLGAEIKGSLGEKVIVLVGETGSGKTSTINTIVNHLLGIRWEDDKRYKLIADREEEKKKSQTTSRTEWITSYTFHQPKTLSYKVTLVDTPGFGDENDNLLTEQIQEFFGVEGTGGIDHIDAVAFVVKASSVRLTLAQKNIFDSVLKLFGGDIRDNIFLFITHAEVTEVKKEDAPVIKAAKEDEIPVKGIFVCNNNVLFHQKDKGETEYEEITRKLYELMWNKMRKNLTKFFNELDTCTPKSLTLSAKVLAERRNLEITVKGLPGLIKSSLVKMNILREEEKVLERFREEREINCNFTYEANEERIIETTLQDGTEATVCNLCQRTCHFPCKKDIFVEIMGLRMCRAMRIFPEFRGCSVCLNHCSVNDHTLGPMKYDRRIVRVTKTRQEMKARYEIAEKNVNNKTAYVRVLKRKQEEAQQEIEKCVEYLRKCVKRLDEIALRTDPYTLVNHLKLLKENEAHSMELGWEDRVKELDQILREEIRNIEEETPAEEWKAIAHVKSSTKAGSSTVSYPMEFCKWLFGLKKEDNTNSINN